MFCRPSSYKFFDFTTMEYLKRHSTGAPDERRKTFNKLSAQSGSAMSPEQCVQATAAVSATLLSSVSEALKLPLHSGTPATTWKRYDP